jgi:hypothetical protein
MTAGYKTVAVATALALMTIGMGSAVTAAERRELRGCTSPDDCGGGGFRLQDSMRAGDGQKSYRLRTRSDDTRNDVKSALKAKQSEHGSFRKRRLIIKDSNDGVGDNSSAVRKRRLRTGDQDRPNKGVERKKKQQAQADWKYDRKKHKRRKHRDDRFRFHFHGFYYPERYWLDYHDPYYRFDSSRISCGEGRDIVSERGFSRVSTVECVGLSYTYLARRSGETYRIIVDARTGDIVSRKRA